MSEEKTYQPHWGEKKKHHHHHHHQNSNSKYTNSWGGWMKMRDKQAYYGLMLVVLAIVGFGSYYVITFFVNELKTLPFDDPTMEMAVDELRIHKAEEQDALLFGDSLAQAYNVDSIRRNVQIETRSVYRPPRRENTWYITKREWQSIWKNYKIWRWERKREEEKAQENKRK